MPPHRQNRAAEAPEKKTLEIKRSSEADLKAIDNRSLTNVVNATKNIVNALQTTNSFETLDGFKNKKYQKQ